MKRVFEQKLEEFRETILKMPWESRSFYENYLAQTYHFVKFNTRIICKAMVQTKPEDLATYKRYLEHINEEINHEFLAVKDLRKLGNQIENFPMKAESKALIGTQHFNIDTYGHSALMGYALALEMIAFYFGPNIYERVSNQFGADACHFIRVHALEDEEHIESAFQLISQFDDQELKIIGEIFEESLQLYANFLSSCISRSLSQPLLLEAA